MNGVEGVLVIAILIYIIYFLVLIEVRGKQ